MSCPTDLNGSGSLRINLFFNKVKYTVENEPALIFRLLRLEYQENWWGCNFVEIDDLCLVSDRSDCGFRTYRIELDPTADLPFRFLITLGNHVQEQVEI